MKTGKNVVGVFLVVVLLLSFVGSVYAITGSIGNARMILRPDVGDTIERSILVKNVNDVAVDVKITVTGDLVDDIVVIDSEFELAAGTEKDAQFTIEVKKAGTTENKFNVAFSPKDGGNGVGLSSTVIIIPQGEEDKSGGGFFGGLFGGGSDDPDVVEGNQENGEVSVGQNKKDDVVEEVGEVEKDGSDGVGLAVLGGTFTIILFVVLLILLVVASKHVQKKRATKSKKKSSRDE